MLMLKYLVGIVDIVDIVEFVHIGVIVDIGDIVDMVENVDISDIGDVSNILFRLTATAHLVQQVVVTRQAFLIGDKLAGPEVCLVQQRSGSRE